MRLARACMALWLALAGCGDEDAGSDSAAPADGEEQAEEPKEPWVQRRKRKRRERINLDELGVSIYRRSRAAGE